MSLFSCSYFFSSSLLYLLNELFNNYSEIKCINEQILVSRFNHFYNYDFQVAVICKAEEGGDAVSIDD